MKFKYILSVLLLVHNIASAQNINTIAGGLGDGGAATSGKINNPNSVAIDKFGNIFISDGGNNLIRKVNTSGIIQNYLSISQPKGIAADTSGNLFVADKNSRKLLKITPAGTSSVYAGTGGGGYSGDGGQATAAALSPYGVAVDKRGNVYVADWDYNNVRKISSSGIISLVAGSGVSGFSGDGGPATTAKLSHPTAICIDKNGNVFIADNYNNRVRKVDTLGYISTFAGNGTFGNSGDGGLAIAATFNMVTGVATDSLGNVYITDNVNGEIRKVDTFGIITRVAGLLSVSGFSGDGGAATAAQLSNPTGITFDLSGNYYIADNANNRIRKVSGGIMTTVAGCGVGTAQGYYGDGGSAISAIFNNPDGLAFDSSYNLYIADYDNNCVRKINRAGIISLVAGVGTRGYNGDGGPATAAQLYSPVAVAADKKGNIYIAGDYKIRKVDKAGIITTYAGGGSGMGGSGDGGLATAAALISASSLTFDKKGNLYVTDYTRIRKIDTNNIITNFAGNGTIGYSGDGAPATAAQIRPDGICFDKWGNLIIADNYNYRVRKVDTSGIITTIAGIGTPGLSGMGGLAIYASIGSAIGVVSDTDGNIFISSGSGRILKIDTAGIITNIAGNGSSSYGGDGGPATAASFNVTHGLAFDSSGNFLVSDKANDRIRVIYNARVSISTPNTTVCTSSAATFTATANAATIYSLHYHWQKNGINVGSDSTQYTSLGFANGDKIVCYITDGPSGTQIARSNEITMNVVSPSSRPFVGFHSSPNTVSTFCGTTVATCTPVSVTLGGNSPVFDWYVNGAYAFTGGSFSFTPANYDTVTVVMTSSISCLTVRTDTFFDYYNHIILPGYPTITIQRSGSGGSTTVCAGSAVTCNIGSASYNAGLPVYDWYRNDTLVSTGTSYYFTPANGDIVKCKMTTADVCALVDTAISNLLVFTVTPKIYPTVAISSDLDTIICGDRNVSCSATTTSGGTSSNFTWYKNDTIVHTYSNKYSFTPKNGDRVYCRFRSNAGCLLNDTAYSNPLNFTVIPPITDSVRIAVTPSDKVCSGTRVTFSATPYNGGATPFYQWYKGSSAIPGASGPVFSLTATSTFEVFCKMYSSMCASPSPVSSNSIHISTIPVPVPHVDLSFSPSSKVCSGVAVTAYATGFEIGSAPVYKWYRNGVGVFTGNSYQFTPVEGDQLYCQLTSNAECIVDSSVNSSITAFNLDTLPSVTVTCTPGNVNFNGTEVTLSASVSPTTSTIQLQWVKNGSPITGATNSAYTSKNFSIWDSVYCRLTASGTCSGTVNSNIQVIQSYHSMRLYPNPNNGRFVINGNNYDANGEPVNIRIYNEVGKMVYEKNTAFDAISFYADIDLGRTLPPGVYTLRMKYKYENLSFFFVIK